MLSLAAAVILVINTPVGFRCVLQQQSGSSCSQAIPSFNSTLVVNTEKPRVMAVKAVPRTRKTASSDSVNHSTFSYRPQLQTVIVHMKDTFFYYTVKKV